MEKCMPVKRAEEKKNCGISRYVSLQVSVVVVVDVVAVVILVVVVFVEFVVRVP